MRNFFVVLDPAHSSAASEFAVAVSEQASSVYSSASCPVGQSELATCPAAGKSPISLSAVFTNWTTVELHFVIYLCRTRREMHFL